MSPALTFGACARRLLAASRYISILAPRLCPHSVADLNPEHSAFGWRRMKPGRERVMPAAWMGLAAQKSPSPPKFIKL